VAARNAARGDGKVSSGSTRKHRRAAILFELSPFSVLQAWIASDQLPQPHRLAMSKRNQLLLTVTALGFLDAVIPLFPILAVILFYVILEKPPWFIALVRELYDTS
jgi:hypothetical protein